MNHDIDNCCHGNASVWQELAHHFPYAVFSVALTLGVLSFTTVTGSYTNKSLDILFHCFHFMHIAFAATGTIITYLRFSRNFWGALIVGSIVPTFFCVLSDVILPYVGGNLLGVHMHWHVCFSTELNNILPFLIAGMINGFVLSQHGVDRQEIYSVFSHFAHILVSSFASSFYLIAHGFNAWYYHIGGVFLFLIGAVVVPCTLSDVVVPMFFAKVKENNEEHTA